MRKKFYITTPIFYPNARLHLGHAYSATLADITARYHRLRGDEVYFLTGADENTEKVVRAARGAGQSPQVYLDGIVSDFTRLFSELAVSPDQFIRTSDKVAHWSGAQELWKRIAARGDFEKRAYQGLYCVGHEAFITEKELVDGKCPEHGEAPQELSEENYFFKLSKYTAEIQDRIESGEFVIAPEARRNEILALLERGLEDVSFSRPAEKVALGIPVPGDPAQKMYVWCDALSSYISALGFGRPDDALFRSFWPADVHIIGKDILRFHAAIWPGMLLSAGLPLPRALFVHGFITSGGRKMSKTLGNVIDPESLIEEYGADAVRLYLARHVSPFEDGDITLESFKAAYNADLANGLGNLVSRIKTMADTFAAPPLRVPIHEPLRYASFLDDKERTYFSAFQFNKVLEGIWSEIASLDKFIAECEPYRTKSIPDVLACLKRLANIAVKLDPFMPQTASEIRGRLTNLSRPADTHSILLFPRKR